MGFEVFPEGYDRGAIYYLEGERVPKSRGIETKGIKIVFNSFMNCQKWGYEGT